MGVARSQRVGAGKNWIMGISVGIDSRAGRVMRVKGTGGFLDFSRHKLFNYKYAHNVIANALRLNKYFLFYFLSLSWESLFLDACSNLSLPH